MIKSRKFIDLLDSPFGRRGSFFAFANDNRGEDLVGKSILWLSSTRIQYHNDFSRPVGFRQIRLELVKDGRVLPAVIDTTPYEVVLRAEAGEVRFTIAERGLVLAKGVDGLTLRITPGGDHRSTAQFFSLPQAIRQRDDIGSILVPFGASKVLLLPFRGKLTNRGPFHEIEPDENGEILIGFEEWLCDPTRRPTSEYPTYEQGLADVKADFDSFCERVCPKLPESYESRRLQALWQTWQMMVEPDGESDYKRTMVKMIHCIFEAAFVWQQPMQAIWLSNDIDLAWTVYMSSFDHMDKNGRLVDTLTYRAQPSEGLKPPIHGLALLWLMKNRDLSGITLEDKLWTWEGLERWTNYWLKFRDCDRDGIVEYQNIIETGWEDSPTYMAGFPNATPELNAMIALNMEALAKFGREIGKDKAVCDEWQAKSEELVARIPEVFWNGEKWFAFNPDTGKKSDSDSIALYSTLMLGKRLPREIIDKSIETLFGPVGFNTEFGLASEATTSPYFRHGFAAGSIITPAQFLMAHALEECGRPDLAREVANKYCAILRDHGFFHIHNALTGREDRSMTAFGERGLFWSAWASSCYFYLAEKYGD